MSNLPRNCKPDLTYHTISRCIELKALMRDDSMKDMVLEIIKRTQEKYNFKFIGYKLMDNHFHFVIQTVENGETISRIMQYIKARIAEGYNRAAGRTGPFWNERYRDIIVEEQKNPTQYLLWLLWYMAFNAVKAGMCCDPRDYKYSSINCYLKEGFTSTVKIIRHQYFEELGVTFAERAKKFLYYEEAYRKRYALLF